MPDLTLEIATPDKLLVSEKVSEVEVPGKEGYMGILPGHAPLISELKAGNIKYVAAGKSTTLPIEEGFVEVLEDKVRILATR